MWQLFEKVLLNLEMRAGHSVEFAAATEIAARIAIGVMSPIYKQVRVDVLGSDHRNLRIAFEYGTRLIEYSKNAKDASTGQSGTISRLVHDYPSHDFVIDRKEAGKLFRNVRRASDDEFRLLVSLGASALLPAWADDTAMVTMLTKSSPT